MFSLKCVDNTDVTDELVLGKIYKEWHLDLDCRYCVVKNDRDKREFYCTDRFEMVEVE